MKNEYTFKDVLASSVIGRHCVYVKLYIDVFALAATYFIVKWTNLSANFVTYLGALLAIISAFFVINGDFFWASTIFYISFMCDFLDGRIARIRKTSSNFGKKLDLAFDRLIFCGLTLCYLYNFQLNGMIFQQVLLVCFAMLFLCYDVLELTDTLAKYRDILSSPIDVHSSYKAYQEKETEVYFYAFRSLKRWVPSRIGSVGFVFILAPAFNINFFYCIALISIFVRLIWFLNGYFKNY